MLRTVHGRDPLLPSLSEDTCPARLLIRPYSGGADRHKTDGPCTAYRHQVPIKVIGIASTAAIAQLGERQTEDLEVPSSILGHGII